MSLLFAAMLLASVVSGSQGVQEGLLVGDWLCDKHCPDEAIAFSVEDGKRRYRSWVSNHPSVVNAEWTLRGSDLTVTRDGAVLYEWQVVQVTKNRLVLRDKGAAAGRRAGDITMKRARDE